MESATRGSDDETVLALVEVGWLRPDDGLDPAYWEGEGKVP